MIWLSQVYGKSIKRDWGEEFSLSNFVASDAPNNAAVDEISTEPSIDAKGDAAIFDAILSAELDRIDSTAWSHAIFSRTDGTSFTVRTKPTLRLVSYVLDRTKKDEFAPNELQGLYGKILDHVLVDSMRKESRDTQEFLRSWVESG